MDKLVEYLASKIGYTLVIVLGFIVPGSVFIFAWNHGMYIAMDIFKIILLSFGISFILFIPNFVVAICITAKKVEDGTIKNEYIAAMIYAIFFNICEITLGIICKMWYENLNIKYFVLVLISIYICLLLVVLIKDFFTLIRNFFKR